ncbi:septal ring lytic transglycosylase RlpA family protein [Desulfobulbus propionicus]|jgi:rare lipoprotein A
MRTSKLVFMVMIGLAILEFSFGQLLNAAPSTGAEQPTVAVSNATFESAAHARKPNKSMRGVASYYADKFNGRKTASGQVFHQGRLTAAHRYLPLGTKVRVTNLRNKRFVEVHINDRGPWRKGRIIDLSKAAAKKLGMIRTGSAMVKLEILNAPSTSNS